MSRRAFARTSVDAPVRLWKRLYGGVRLSAARRNPWHKVEACAKGFKIRHTCAAEISRLRPGWRPSEIMRFVRRIRMTLAAAPNVQTPGHRLKAGAAGS